MGVETYFVVDIVGKSGGLEVQGKEGIDLEIIHELAYMEISFSPCLVN